MTYTGRCRRGASDAAEVDLGARSMYARENESFLSGSPHLPTADFFACIIVRLSARRTVCPPGSTS